MKSVSSHQSSTCFHHVHAIPRRKAFLRTSHCMHFSQLRQIRHFVSRTQISQHRTIPIEILLAGSFCHVRVAQKGHQSGVMRRIVHDLRLQPVHRRSWIKSPWETHIFLSKSTTLSAKKTPHNSRLERQAIIHVVVDQSLCNGRSIRKRSQRSFNEIAICINLSPSKSIISDSVWKTITTHLHNICE